MRILNKAILAVCLLSMAACASINPFGAAKSLEQKSYALYGSFVIFEEQGAKLIKSAEVPNSVKVEIQKADKVAKPAADSLKPAADSLITAKRQLDAGTTTKEKVQIAVTNLSSWYSDAAPKIKCLINAVEESPCSN